jgi:hypothetical protein
VPVARVILRRIGAHVGVRCGNYGGLGGGCHLGCRRDCDYVKCVDGTGYCRSHLIHMVAYFFIVWVN